MNIYILVLIIGGIAAVSDCDDGALCFEQKTNCERFAQRIILNNNNIAAMCQRIESDR
jgi:hypothetical protein|tara:strand:- start:256 stop:429 length:174 start_codon:yes stop_codon:yes gene_type:complete